MTDKQIIIDGVNVSECNEFVNECDCYLTQEHDYRSETPYTYDKCSEFPNCYYKQLKRKEQECEELKAENQKLKEKLLDLKLQVEEAYKYKQTITEIKEIADRIDILTELMLEE